MNKQKCSIKVKEWVNSGEEHKPFVARQSLSKIEKKSANDLVFSVSRAYCEFQDIVKSKKMPKKNIWAELDKLDEWVYKQERDSV